MFRTNAFQKNFKTKFNQKFDHNLNYNFNKSIMPKTYYKPSSFAKDSRFVTSLNSKSKPLTINHNNWSNKINTHQILHNVDLVKHLQLFNLIHKSKKSYFFQRRTISSDADERYKDYKKCKKSIIRPDSFGTFVIVKILFIGFSFICLFVLDLTRGPGSFSSFNLFTLITFVTLPCGLVACTIPETLAFVLIASVCLILHVLCA